MKIHKGNRGLPQITMILVTDGSNVGKQLGTALFLIIPDNTSS